MTNNKLTAAALVSANLTANDCGSLLGMAGKAIVDSHNAASLAALRGASGLAVMIAGLAYDGSDIEGDNEKANAARANAPANRVWSFDIEGSEAGEVHHHVEQVGWSEFMRDAKGAWVRTSSGGVSSLNETAYKSAFCLQFFGLKAVASLWTKAHKAVGVAQSIRAENMQASIVDGKLVLTGGTSEKAEAMREATSTAKLMKASKGETASAKGKSSDSSKASEATPASLSDIAKAALQITKGIIMGTDAADTVTLQALVALSKLVADNPKAFATD
jgi:hypothetical protein